MPAFDRKEDATRDAETDRVLASWHVDGVSCKTNLCSFLQCAQRLARKYYYLILIPTIVPYFFIDTGTTVKSRRLKLDHTITLTITLTLTLTMFIDTGTTVKSHRLRLMQQ